MMRKVIKKKNKNEFNPNIFQETTRIFTRLNREDLLNELIESVKSVILPHNEWSFSYIKSKKLQHFFLNLEHNPNDEKNNLVYKYSENILLKRCDSEIIPIKHYILKGEQIDALPEFLKYLNDCIIKFEENMELFLLIERIEKNKGNETKLYKYYFVLRNGSFAYEYIFEFPNSTEFLDDLIDKIDSFHNLNIKYDFLNFEPKIIIESKYKKIKIEYALYSYGYYPEKIKIMDLLLKGNKDIDPKSFDVSKTFNLTYDKEYDEIKEFIIDFKDHEAKDYENLDYVLKIEYDKFFIYIRCNDKLFSYEFIPKKTSIYKNIKKLFLEESIYLYDSSG